MVFYFIMPKTRKRTLEDLDEVFAAHSPVKASLIATKVAVDSEGTITAAEKLNFDA